MKIAIILPQLTNPGGAERVVSYLANYWYKCGYKIILITFAKQQSICYKIDNNIQILSLCKSATSKLSIINFITCINNLKKLLLLHKIDVAIGIDIRANLLLRLASFSIKNLITIATEHRHPPLVPQNKLLLKIIRHIYSSMDVMVALTKQSQLWFTLYTKFKQVALIPNPIIYPLVKQQPIIIPNNIINTNKKTLLAVGRLHPQKGFDLLIPIFAKLVTKNTNWQLVILGEGQQRQQLTSQIQKLQLDDKVYLAGAVGNVVDWYQIADLFVFSSRYEGFGCVLVEAMAYGLPCVSFDCPTGPSDIITHKVDGLLVENGDIKKLEYTLDYLMNDTLSRTRIATNATKIINRFSINAIMSEWQYLFDSAFYKG